MPGIVGLITKMPKAQAAAELSRMLEAIHHEPFYATGTWMDEALGVYVGWTVIKNSFADGMPIANENGDLTLVFSGEEYPEPETLGQLRQKGHTFAAERSSYLVHLAEEDPSFPAGLNGMFHGLLADLRRGTATLFNDRYGMHRIYYHEAKDALYFAGEAKAILAVRPELRTADPQGLGEFVSCSCVLDNRTIFKGIRVMPAGSTWVFRNGTLERMSSYFQPREWEEQATLSMDGYYQELRESLARTLPRYFVGPERMGVALTGGLDTRVIMAWQKSQPGEMPCYTFGGPFRDCHDVRVARRIAELCQQSHQVITVGDEFLKNFSTHAERTVSLTEGTVDVYRASDLFVSAKAREIAPAKIVGTYGSEIVRQAVMFKPSTPMPGLYRPDFLNHVQQGAGTYAGFRRENPVTFAAFRQSPWYHHGVLALEQSQLIVRSPFMDNDFVRTVFRGPALAASNGDVRLLLIRDGSKTLARIPSDRGIGGNGNALASAINRNILEFTFKAEYAYDYGMPQWVSAVDHFFAPLQFQRLFLGRHKFLHYRVWYRDALAQYVREMLLDPRTLSRPYLERKGVETIVNGHLSGGRNYTTEIHKLLTLELLHRLFLDSQ